MDDIDCKFIAGWKNRAMCPRADNNDALFRTSVRRENFERVGNGGDVHSC